MSNIFDFNFRIIFLIKKLVLIVNVKLWFEVNSFIFERNFMFVIFKMDFMIDVIFLIRIFMVFFVIEILLVKFKLKWIE